MSETPWKKILIAGIGAAGAAAILYYLMKEEPKKKSQAQESKDAPAAGKSKVEELSKENVQQILKEIIESQEQMKKYMKDLTKELRTKNMSFDETYDRVRKVQPSDPLEKHQLTMMEFDQLLDKYQSDPMVREAIAKIMGTPNASTQASEKVQGITVKMIIEVHNFMLKELEDLVEKYQGMQKNRELDSKTVTIVAQAIIGAKMETKFDITSEDIESAVLMYHTMLATDQEFANINLKIQHTMGKLMGTPFQGGQAD
jgi:hypothetical protein